MYFNPSTTSNASCTVSLIVGDHSKPLVVPTTRLVLSPPFTKPLLRYLCTVFSPLYNMVVYCFMPSFYSFRVLLSVNVPRPDSFRYYTTCCIYTGA